MKDSTETEEESGREWRGSDEGSAHRRFGETHIISDPNGHHRNEEHDEPLRTAHFSVRPLSISPLEKQRLESEKFRDSGRIQSDLRTFPPDTHPQNYERYPPYGSHVSQDPTRGEQGISSPSYGRSRYPSHFGRGHNTGPGFGQGGSQGFGEGFGRGYNGRQSNGYGYNSEYNVYNTDYKGAYNTAPSSGFRGWYDRFLSGMSGGYGDHDECDCVAYNLLGVGTAAATSAALAAVLLFANLTNVGRSLDDEWTFGVEVLDLTGLLAEPMAHLTRGEGVVWDGSDPRSAFGRVLHRLPDGVIQRSLLYLAGRLKPHTMAGVAVSAVCHASGYRGQGHSQYGTSSMRGRVMENIGISARDGKEGENVVPESNLPNLFVFFGKICWCHGKLLREYD